MLDTRKRLSALVRAATDRQVVGGRRATIRDLAEIHGVSPAQVSAALRGAKGEDLMLALMAGAPARELAEVEYLLGRRAYGEVAS